MATVDAAGGADGHVYPILFSIDGFHVATYGGVVALAFLAAGLLAARGFEDRGMDPDEAWTLMAYALVFGLVGAKLYYAVLHGPDALLSRGGLVWYGGLLAGSAGVGWAIHRRALPLLVTLDVLAPALALGHGVGHVACFFSGDSYGVPSDLPWAVAFPRGAPPSTAGNLRRAFGVDVPAGVADQVLLTVHPTMLYSALVLLLLSAFLWWYRRRSGTAGRLFGLYLVLAGTERFLVEFLRAKDDRLLGGFTLAQLIAAALFLTGVFLLWKLFRDRTAPVRGGDAPHDRALPDFV